jgi:replicative DNA helicase
MEVRAKSRRLKAECNLGLVVVDYLQLMHVRGRSESRQQEISEISRSLKSMARELRVPVVAASQLSRAVEARNDKRPLLSDLRESGAIEQDADVVAFIYRDSYYNRDSDKGNVAEIIVAKQRNGPTETVELVFLKESGRFMDLERRRPDGG